MMLNEYQGSRSLFGLGQTLLELKKNFFYLRFCRRGSFETKFITGIYYGSTGMKIYINELGHVEKIGATPI